MNVTRSNWNQLLPFIKETLKKADLVAIDFEMTGVQASPQLRNQSSDSIQERYWKNKENVKRFLPLQIGICGFQFKDSRLVEAYPFNIYLYPFTGNDALDRMFFFNSGAIQFLAQHNFDFNRTFYDGVFYLSKETEQLIIEYQQMNDLKENLRKLSRSIDPDMLAYLQLHLKKVIQFFSSDQQQLGIEIKFIKVRNYKYLLEHVEKVANSQKYHVVYDSEIFFKRSKMTIIKGENETLQQIEQPIEVDPIGVRQLIDQLIWQKTPLLLHNGLTDLSQLYDKFLFSLPEQSEEFRQDIHQAFPIIYDTKFIIKNSQILNQKDSNLTSCFKQMGQYSHMEPHIKINEDFGEYQLHPDKNEQTSNSQEHEAGYDALMTGYVFIKSAALLTNGKTPTSNSFVLDHEKLKFYRNKLPLGQMKSPFNLEEDDTKQQVEQRQIFYLSQIQKIPMDESKIRDYFTQNELGDIHLSKSLSQSFEYFMTFGLKSQGDLYKKVMRDGSTIIKVDGRHIIISVFENHQQQMQRRVKDEYDMKSMSMCLERFSQK